MILVVLVTKDDNISNIILNKLSEGVISISNEGIIQIINRKAKEVFGIVYIHKTGHKKGVIKKGDIVIIGDSSIGMDDGGMDSSDLKQLLGIRENIFPGSSLVYIGRYMGGGEYKYQSGSENNDIAIEKVIDGKEIECYISPSKKIANIAIDGIEYPYNFVNGIGHMVILDKDTLHIKFYQDKGYSVRKESIKNLLSQSSFNEKLSGVEMETRVEGKNITDVLGISESIMSLIKCAKGQKIDYTDKYDEINGRPVRCSISPLKAEGRAEGAFLTLEDLSEITNIRKERDEIFNKLIETDKRTYDPFNELIGESKKMKDIKTYAKKAALSSSTILISGESGTGKSLMAKAIHEYSRRKDRKFVEINCGALSPTLIESELFGYEPGAFTGAHKSGKKGLIESADKGTLFLDEISEIPFDLQVKILHVIQNKKIIPVGASNSKTIDVRFICACNKNLKKMVDEGKFREDLYYRVNVMPIELPALRDRKEDLYMLTHILLNKISKKQNVQYRTLSNEAFNKLYSYDFPGNVRELENILERALNISEGTSIIESDIILGAKEIESKETENKIYEKPLKEILDEAEKKAISNCMKKYNGDKEKVMNVLKIKKTSFYEKIKKYNL